MTGTKLPVLTDLPILNECNSKRETSLYDMKEEIKVKIVYKII